MNTNEYLDKVREIRALPSDYALAKALGVAKQTISNYRNGKTHLDESVSRRVAEILGMHPGLVMLDMQRERARTPEDRSVWQEIFEGFRKLWEHANVGKGTALA